MKSILLVTIDCLRPDHIGLYDYHRNTTPFMDSLGKKGIKYELVFATGSSTPYSFPGLLSSTYPLDYSPIPSMKHPMRETLASVLSKHGFVTAAFHSNEYTSIRHSYDRGFSTFVDLVENRPQPEEKPPDSPMKRFLKRIPGARSFYRKVRKRTSPEKPVLPYVRAPKTTDTVTNWLSEQSGDTPVFLWVHYMDPHAPFLFSRFFSEWNNRSSSPPPHFPSKRLDFPDQISPDEHQLIIDLYDAEIKLVDSQLPQLVSKWNSVFPDSIITITADHGEEFLEHGSYSHTAKLFDELIHVPLIIVGVEGQKKVNTDLVSLLDIPPTLLDVNGFPPEKRFLGQSIFSTNYEPRDYIIAETMESAGRVSMNGTGNQKVAIRARKWKFIYETEGPPQFYDLVKDSRESVNIIEQKQELLPELEKLVEIHQKRPMRDYQSISKLNL